MKIKLYIKQRPCPPLYGHRHESRAAIARERETEVVIILKRYTLSVLSIHALESREESGRAYGLLEAEDSRCA